MENNLDKHGIVRTLKNIEEARKIITSRKIGKTKIHSLIEEYKAKKETCKACRNHPDNGGSGICNCTLGIEPIIC